MHAGNRPAGAAREVGLATAAAPGARAERPVTGRHQRRLARRLDADLEFRAEHERQRRVIGAIDGIVDQLDALRVGRGLSYAKLARAIGKHPASVRRLLTARGNPELGTIVAMADALSADVVVVPRARGGAAR